MAISTSKPEIYAEGTTDISWTRLQSNPLLQGANDLTNIRFGQYKRDTSDAEEPLVPDAEENADIGTEESGNLRVGAFRGAIKRHDVTFDKDSEYQNVQFDKYFGANLVKNLPKVISVGGTIYSDDATEPAAKIVTEDGPIRNLNIGIETSGAIYGAGAAATTASQGIAGGTALYVSSGTNSRNFEINLKSSGGSFGKLYGGGGGGVTGEFGTPGTSTCARVETTAGPTGRDGAQRVGSRPETSYYPCRDRRTTAGFQGPALQPNVESQTNQGGVQGRTDVELARRWNARAESFCRNNYGGNSYDGGADFGGSGIYGYPFRNLYDPNMRLTQPNPNEPGSFDNVFVQGTVSFKCNVPGPWVPGETTRTPDICSQTVFVTRERGDSETITSPGGIGGAGGKGQGYQRAFTIGGEGSPATEVECSSLGTLWSGPPTTGTIGRPGTSGGDWGEDAPSSVGVATGGLAGFAIEKSDSNINIEIIGDDDVRIKGRRSS